MCKSRSFASALKGWPLESGRYNCGSPRIAIVPTLHDVLLSRRRTRAFRLPRGRILDRSLFSTKETLHGTSRHALHDLRRNLLLLVLGAVLGSFFTVQTAEVAIVQRLGKFARVAGLASTGKTPFIENVVRRMSMKVLQFDVQVETKTQDKRLRADPRLHPIQSPSRRRRIRVLQAVRSR